MILCCTFVKRVTVLKKNNLILTECANSATLFCLHDCNKMLEKQNPICCVVLLWVDLFVQTLHRVQYFEMCPLSERLLQVGCWDYLSSYWSKDLNVCHWGVGFLSKRPIAATWWESPSGELFRSHVPGQRRVFPPKYEWVLTWLRRILSLQMLFFMHIQWTQAQCGHKCQNQQAALDKGSKPLGLFYFVQRYFAR